MNPRLGLLQPYPFERLNVLLAGVKPPAGLAPVSLSLGEPQHPTPDFIKQALAANFSGLARYPLTKGLPELRQAIAGWLTRRHGIPAVDAQTQVLPVSGTREALFSIAQAVLDPADAQARVICPNPFYQIYEGAALLGGAKPLFVNADGARGGAPDWEPSPKPTGRVPAWFTPAHQAIPRAASWRSDECYSEIYFDESAPPLGALAAAHRLGRAEFPRLVVMGSLSKRSNVPGLRSGFVAGDAQVLKPFLLYRTYHGSALSNTVQQASIAAWNDEAHVLENRRLYREKFATFFDLVNPALPLSRPDAAFYFWCRVPGDDEAFARDLYAATGVVVLPGSYLSREAHGTNPGRGYVRMALVSTVAEAAEAGRRIADFARERCAAETPS